MSLRILLKRESILAFRSRFRKTFSSFSSSVIRPASSVQTAQVQNPLVRHGEGDAVLKLNVGGTEFTTLRSTAESNATLYKYVTAAETNGELTSGGAVFIDRDPKYFGMILAYLRNRIDGLSYNSKFGKLSDSPHYIKLPEDGKALSDLFIEARHFRLFDLEKQLCTQNFFTTIASLGGSNPFETVGTWLKTARRALLGFAGGGSILLTLQHDVETILPFRLPAFLRMDEVAGDEGATTTKQLPSGNGETA